MENAVTRYVAQLEERLPRYTEFYVLCCHVTNFRNTCLEGRIYIHTYIHVLHAFYPSGQTTASSLKGTLDHNQVVVSSRWSAVTNQPAHSRLGTIYMCENGSYYLLLFSMKSVLLVCSDLSPFFSLSVAMLEWGKFGINYRFMI